jgi:hypothetical protein
MPYEQVTFPTYRQSCHQLWLTAINDVLQWWLQMSNVTLHTLLNQVFRDITPCTSTDNYIQTQHYWHVYVLAGAYFVWPWSPHRTICDVTPGPLSATDRYIVYKRCPSYELRKHICGSGLWRGRGTKKTKAIRCGACYYSIVLNAHRVTSMADTDIDAVRKQKKAEYNKQYRLKRKLLLQQQASKDINMIRYFHP